MRDFIIRRSYLYAIVVLIIILVVIGLAIAAQNNGGGKTALTSYDNKPVPNGLLNMLMIPDNISNSIGPGTATSSGIIQINNKSLLMADGKPEVLYIGAEFCPYCAAMRWPMIIALSRFGTFSNLHLMTSSSTDTPPSVPTYTFYNSTYTSNYITFVSVETTTNVESVPLQKPNASEGALFAEYNPGGGIPFLLFANKSVLLGSTYLPQETIAGANWSVTAASLHNASSLQAQAIIGSANLITAEICKADGNEPANVCSQPYVTQAGA